MIGDDLQPPDDDEELQRILAELTTLQLVSVFIDRLAEDLPTPGTGMDDGANVMSLLGQRAKSLYENFHYSLGSPVEFAPVLAVRPLIELVILTKWMTLDLVLHPFLYLAGSDASELAHIAAVTDHAKARGQPVPEAVADATAIKVATRDAAFAKLKELGRNYGQYRIMPNVRRMAAEVSSTIPGHKSVMDDSYIYGYKTFSPWEHTEASSFKVTARETAPGEWEWLGDNSPWHPGDVEAIASSMFAYVLETVFATLADAEKALMARQLRDHIITNYVRSDAVQPPSGKPVGGPNRPRAPRHVG